MALSNDSAGSSAHLSSWTPDQTYVSRNSVVADYGCASRYQMKR